MMMKSKLIIKLEMSNDETLEVWVCARQAIEGWQGGIHIKDTVTWFQVYAKTANKAIEAMTKCLSVGLDDGQLVIKVNKDE